VAFSRSTSAGKANDWNGRASQNRVQGRRAVGGKLYTNQRLLFSPRLLERLLGGHQAEIELADIPAIRTKPKGGSQRFAGSQRDRLQIELKDGESELFVVNRIDRTIERLRQASKPS